MSEQSHVGGVTYSPKEMFQEIRTDIGKIVANVDFLTRQIEQERSFWEQRFAKMEIRLATAEEQIAKLVGFEKDFLGFESRFRLHEAAMYHPSAQDPMARLVLDMEQQKANDRERSTLDEYIKGQATQRTADSRWRMGFIVATLFQSAMLMLALAKAFGVFG